MSCDECPRWTRLLSLLCSVLSPSIRRFLSSRTFLSLLRVFSPCLDSREILLFRSNEIPFSLPSLLPSSSSNSLAFFAKRSLVFHPSPNPSLLFFYSFDRTIGREFDRYSWPPRSSIFLVDVKRIFIHCLKMYLGWILFSFFYTIDGHIPTWYINNIT